MRPDRLGWILIHSHTEYPDGDYATPQEQLDSEYQPGNLWHWKLPRPLRKGGPYTLLLAWDGEVFGEAEAEVTHTVKFPAYNFAFRLMRYEAVKPVPLTKLPVPRSHRSLIKLTPEILAEYHHLAKAQCSAL